MKHPIYLTASLILHVHSLESTSEHRWKLFLQPQRERKLTSNRENGNIVAKKNPIIYLMYFGISVSLPHQFQILFLIFFLIYSHVEQKLNYSFPTVIFFQVVLTLESWLLEYRTFFVQHDLHLPSYDKCRVKFQSKQKQTS